MDRENVIYIYTLENYSDIEKGNIAICDNMDGPWGYYAKWNKTEKYKYYIFLICGIF